MNAAVCKACRSPKLTHSCGLCHGPLCKLCTEPLKPNTFGLLDPVPAELTHRHYCAVCYFNTVAPALDKYTLQLAQAKDVFVFMKTQGEETRFLSRAEKPLVVSDCDDSKEALLRLAFRAVEAGFNTLIRVEISHRKVRNAGYQTTKWQATGIPTQADAAHLNKTPVWKIGF